MTLLDRNYLVRIYRDVFELERTNEIRIVGTELEEVDEAAFKGLVNLETIKLFHCSIIELPSNVFTSCGGNLKELNLSGNKLTRIDDQLLKGLGNLERLDLAYNEIEEIHPEAFCGLVNLKELNLNSNKLFNLHRNCFKSLNAIEWVYLQGNNFDPDVYSFNKNLTNLHTSHRITCKWEEFLKQFPDGDGSRIEVIRPVRFPPIILPYYNTNRSYIFNIARNCNPKRNYCSTCSKKFKSKKALLTHIRFSFKHKKC